MAATLETPEQRSLARRRYTEEEIERGLLVLALNGGRPQRASEELEERFGQRIPNQTLCDWRDRIHADRYSEIAADQQARVRERTAARYEQVVAAATDAQLAAIERYQAVVGNIPADKLAGDARNLGTAAGIAADKGNAARDRPTAIIEHRQPDEVIAALRGIGFGVIEGTAEPIENAELVDEVPATTGDRGEQRAQP